MIFAMLKRNDLTLMTRELYGERWDYRIGLSPI